MKMSSENKNEKKKKENVFFFEGKTFIVKDLKVLAIQL